MKSDITTMFLSLAGVLLCIGAVLSAYDLGRSQNEHLLNNCSSGIDIRHNGRLVRCGVIDKEVGLAAARYSVVKRCIKTVEDWKDETTNNN